MAFQWLERERALVVCHNAMAPDRNEWSGYLELQRRIADIQHRALIYAVTPISRAQQQELAAATKSSVSKSRVALISPSTAVRFIGCMFTLMNGNVRFFGPEDYASALAHLGFAPDE